MTKQISIIIIHWNTPDLLEKQLKGLAINSNNIDITVVDNASEKSLDWIKKKFPAVTLIKNQFNRGFAFATNRGAIEANGHWLFFLNPDVEINSGQIRELIDFAEKEKLDAGTPRPQSRHYSRPIPSLLSLLAEFTPLKHLISERFFPLKTMPGGTLLIKRGVFESLGGFDERFFLWFEDSDLTRRLYDNGHKFGPIPVNVNHRGGASFEKLDQQARRDLFFQAMDVYAKKHFRILGQLVVKLIKYRYSRRQTLPVLFDQAVITIPNMKKALLEEFLKKNSDIILESGEYIVVSSAISGSAVWQWRQKNPTIRFIPIKDNKGFASVVNIGFRASAGAWLGTVNDDVALSHQWLEKLLKSDHDNVGSINPAIKKPDGTIESFGIRILKKGKAIPIQSENNIAIDATNAAAVLYFNDVLNKVGLFDERFGSYLEDIDLSLRISKAGFKHVIAKNVLVIHRGQTTSQSKKTKKAWQDLKNWWLVILKNWSLQDLFIYSPAILIERLRNLSGVIKSLF